MRIVTAVFLAVALTGAAALAESAAPAGTRVIVGVSGMH
jgi:hypothetical protein